MTSPPVVGKLAMRLLRTIILSTLLTLPGAGAAYACSCAPDPTAEGLLQDSAAVFTGVAQGSTQVAPGVSVTTFRVTESFKGVAAGTTVRVRHRSGSSASCGVKFAPDTSYTLAAGRGDGSVLSTSLCSTWMFLPQVGTGAALIDRLRALRGR